MSEEDNESTVEKSNQETVLAETVDSLAKKLKKGSFPDEPINKKNESGNDSEMMSKSSEDLHVPSAHLELTNSKTVFKEAEEKENTRFCSAGNANLITGEALVKYPRKVTFLFELLSACVADTPQEKDKNPRLRKGYDARYRTALRLLTTWLNVKWRKMVCIFHTSSHN